MRIEKDSMGEMQVADDALYGASTQRAVLNFPISDLRFPKEFIAALGVIKKSAALANHALGLLPEDKLKPICAAADEVISGALYKQFVVDVFQTGSGTSTNMNANEVIANRAAVLMGGKLGDKNLVHPNDHVNMSQSSNDVIPTAIHVSLLVAIEKKLIPGLKKLQQALQAKEREFAQIIKAGRTHLQDATPITLGQEFGGYAAQIDQGIKRLQRSRESLKELALGGTAVGTGLNTHPKFPSLAIAEIVKLTGVEFVEASNHFEAQAARDAVVEMSGQFRTIACSLIKIANDIRWLAAGPRCSLGELRLPEIQPGSSIMPAKVNPVICEAVMMVASRVIGNDACIAIGGQHGNFELNVMLPIIGHSSLESANLLASVAETFVDKCISGIKANEDVCKRYAELSLATCTSLAPIVGYDKAAKVAKDAYAEGLTVREMALKQELLPPEELDKALDLMAMTKPGL